MPLVSSCTISTIIDIPFRLNSCNCAQSARTSSDIAARPIPGVAQADHQQDRTLCLLQHCDNTSINPSIDQHEHGQTVSKAICQDCVSIKAEISPCRAQAFYAKVTPQNLFRLLDGALCMTSPVKNLIPDNFGPNVTARQAQMYADGLASTFLKLIAGSCRRCQVNA